MNAILMTEEYWMNSQFSIVRHYGKIKIDNKSYILVNKEGKDIFQCSIEAEKAGREKAIEAGEPADLVDVNYVPIYRKVGRDRFIEMVKQNLSLKEMKEASRVVVGKTNVLPALRHAGNRITDY